MHTLEKSFFHDFDRWGNDGPEFKGEHTLPKKHAQSVNCKASFHRSVFKKTGSPDTFVRIFKRSETSFSILFLSIS
jgi:hypothetical protein